RAQVGDQVSSQVRAQVGDQVSSQVRAQVRAQVWDQKLEYLSFASYGSVSDFGWLSFYDFFERIGIEYKNEKYAKFVKLVRSGVYDMIQLKEYCLVCPLPEDIHRDETNRLHSTKGMAIKWADGYGQHYLWGVGFDEKLWKRVT